MELVGYTRRGNAWITGTMQVSVQGAGIDRDRFRHG
jgi:hypothetical protein